MRLPIRTHVILVLCTLAATFGLGQGWGMISSMREGTAGTTTMITGSFGILLLLISGAILARLFHSLGSGSSSLNAKRQHRDSTIE